ncbi:MAG: AAA family ATPase, partial [Ilumatobacteraceae bacterium]
MRRPPTDDHRGGSAMNAIVGRGVEVDHIRRLVDDDGCAVLTLVGEPGIGKSTLLDLACARAAQHGITVRRTDADEIGVSQPFGFLGGLLGTAWQPAQADLQPLALVDAALDALERSTPDGRLLLALDNLQWADPGSLRVLASVLRRSIPHGWKAILAMRPGYSETALERLRDATVEVGGLDLPIAPLTSHETLALTRERLGAMPSTALAAAVQQAGGNPFYITTLLRDLDFHHRLHTQGSTVSLDDGAVAPTLSRLLLRRARDLGPYTFELLQTAAVLGRTMAVHDLAALHGAEVADVVPSLSAATDAQLLSADGDELTFRHDLVVSALRDDTPPAARRALHRRALTLLQASGARADRLAPHLLALEPGAVDAQEAVRVARACSPEVGLRVVEHALGGVADDDFALAVCRPELLLWSGQPQLAVDAAAELIERHGDDPRIEPARAVHSHGMFLMGKAREFTAESADDLAAHVTGMTPARYKAEMALAVLFAADTRRARTLADDAVRLNAAAPAADHDVTEAVARAVRGFIDAAHGRLDEGLTDLRAASVTS